MNITLQRELVSTPSATGTRTLILGHANLVLAVLLAAAGTVLWRVPLRGIGEPTTLAGAFYVGTALLLAVWIGQLYDKSRADDAVQQRKDKIKILIAAELTTVAVGLMDSKTRVDAALALYQPSERAGGDVDLVHWLPRAMDLTESLWSEVLVLDRRAIDVLALLRSNLLMTASSMCEADNEGRLTSTRLSTVANELRFDLGILSQAFECIAPMRQIELTGQAPEIASALLRRLSVDPLPLPAPIKPSWWRRIDEMH